MRPSIRDVQLFLKELSIRSVINGTLLFVSRTDMVNASGQATEEECHTDIQLAVLVNFEHDVLVAGKDDDYIFWKI
jgi:hypothetical protein